MARADKKSDRQMLRRRIKEIALEYNRSDKDRISPTQIRRKVREELREEDNE